MKKLAIAVVGLLCFAPVAFADTLGLGVYLGGGKNNPQYVEDLYDSVIGNKELDKGNVFGGVEILYEWDLSNEFNKFGIKLGFDVYGENEFKVWNGGGWPIAKVQEKTSVVPLTLYYRYDGGVGNLSFFLGGGVSYMYSELKIRGTLRDTETHSNGFWHTTAGVEYRFTQSFALGVDCKYNFDAKVKRRGFLYSDREGLNVALAGRFYL